MTRPRSHVYTLRFYVLQGSFYTYGRAALAVARLRSLANRYYRARTLQSARGVSHDSRNARGGGIIYTQRPDPWKLSEVPVISWKTAADARK